MKPLNSVQATRVWDLPTRLFHWTLALAVTGAVITANIGGNAMAWHFRLGYLIFALLAFRLVWGLVGGYWSRFIRFVYTPVTIVRYLRGAHHPDEFLDVGHNPLGSFSVFAMLAVLVAQVATGLVADDEIVNTGPLNRFVSSDFASSATGWHKGYGQWLIYALVGLHVAAIIWYLLRQKKNLAGPMVVGDKLLPVGTPASRDGMAQRVLAVAVVCVCAAAVAWTVSLGG
jgi:cytochrome b